MLIYWSENGQKKNKERIYVNFIVNNQNMIKQMEIIN